MTELERLERELEVVELETELEALEAKPAEPKGDPSWIDRINAFGQGMSLGSVDEMVILPAAVAASIATGDNFADVYTSMTESEADKRKKYKKENPWESGLLELGGGLTTGGALGKYAMKVGGQVLGTAAPAVAAVTSKVPASQKRALAKALKTGKNVKGSKTLNKIAKAAGAGSVGAGIYGFASEEGGLEKRAAKAAKDARMGALFGGGLQTLGSAAKKAGEKIKKPWIAQDLGRGDDFLTIPHAATEETNMVRNFYDTIAKNAFGSQLPKQSQRVAAKQLPTLRRETDRLRGRLASEEGLSVARREDLAAKRQIDLANNIAADVGPKKKGIREAAKVAKQQAIQQQENTVIQGRQQAEALKAAERLRFHNELMERAAPVTSTSDEIAQLKQLNATDPQAAMRALNDVKGKRFASIQNENFLIAPDALVKSAVGDIKGVAGVGDYADEITANILRTTQNRLMYSGEELMDVRNQLRVIANDTGLGSGAKQKKYAYSQAAKAIDDQMKAQMPEEKAAQFAAELDSYKYLINLQDASKKAGTKRGGEIDIEDWMSTTSNNSSFTRGETPHYNEARKLQKTRNALDAKTKDLELKAKTDRKGAENTIATQQTQSLDELSAYERQQQLRNTDELTAFKRQVKESAPNAKKSAVSRLSSQIERNEAAEKALVKAGKPDKSLFSRAAASAIIPALGGGVFGGPLGATAAVLGSVATAKGITSEGFQRLIAGQSGAQKALSKALRGETEAQKKWNNLKVPEHNLKFGKFKVPELGLEKPRLRESTLRFGATRDEDEDVRYYTP